MEVKVEYISAACNRTYNCVELSDNFIIFGANKAIAIYDIQEEKVVTTSVHHKGRVNCVRFVKNTKTKEQYLVTCCSGGVLILWKSKLTDDSVGIGYTPKVIQEYNDISLTVCDGIQSSQDELVLGCITTESQVHFYTVNLKDSDNGMKLAQEINLKKSLANDLVFHAFQAGDIVLALGMDSGSVILHDLNLPNKTNSSKLETNGSINILIPLTTLSKHEDWVRCINFVTLDNGDTLMASGGEDSYIAVWRFTRSKSDQSNFEFQVHEFKEYTVVFDSMIIGHEGWINSLHWNPQGQLISCSSDQSIIIWENMGDLWIEKSRFGVTGGNTPGGFCAKFNSTTVISSGFQGAIQIWNKNKDQWELRPSVTGHFAPISDLDYDSNGQYVVTTSEDQTTRVHAPWGIGRWHEISRPQIHGHDLFACRITKDNRIVSGAEEKILRAFQSTEIFYKNLEDASEILIEKKDAARAAFLPALGLSNQSDVTEADLRAALDQSLEIRLDEDFLRSQTLWLEVSKLYGHVYEISCIATSPIDPLVASASQATKPQFAAIILWCSNRWKNIGEFPFHKLNVTGMEFSQDGKRLLSVSRDRTWAVWKVFKKDDSDFAIEVLDSGNLHTRALWVGTWAPSGDYFVTGARDKKLMVWKQNSGDKYEYIAVQTFDSSVSAAAINSDGLIAIGLESGCMEFYQSSFNLENKKLDFRLKLDNNIAHHDTIKRIKFNPKEKFQLASVGMDNILKVYELTNL